MKKECTEQDLRELARSAQAVFEAVTLTEAPLCDGWQDDGLRGNLDQYKVGQYIL